MAVATPATVLLQRLHVPFTVHTYEVNHIGAHADFGGQAAEALGVDPGRIFKTLIAAVDSNLVCAVVPVAGHLDLKALARAAGGKRAAMADVAAAQRATGYVVGGISPLGQRSRLAIFVDSSVASFDSVFVSGGKRGLQLELAPHDLRQVTGAETADLATV